MWKSTKTLIGKTKCSKYGPKEMLRVTKLGIKLSGSYSLHKTTKTKVFNKFCSVELIKSILTIIFESYQVKFVFFY